MTLSRSHLSGAMHPPRFIPLFFRLQHRLLTIALQGVLLSLLISITLPLHADSIEIAAALPAADEIHTFNVPAGPLDAALDQFAHTAGVNLYYDAALLGGLQSKGLSGNYTTASALSLLLAGSGIEAAPQPGGGYSLRKVTGSNAVTTLPSINVSANSLWETTEGTGSYTTGYASTATKLQLSLRETPQSVSVITRQRMDDQHMVTLEDAMRTTPDLTIDKSGPQRTSFYARGSRITNITYDGLPTSLDTSWYGDDVLLADLAIYDRVEVVRGATGLTQGAGNPSAAINLVRKRPTGNLMASVTPSAGSWSRYGAEVDISGPLSTNKSIRGRIVATYRDHGSFQDVVNSKRKIFYAIGEADLGDRTILTIGAYRQKNDNRTSWGGLPAAPDGSDLKLGRSTYLGNDWDRWDKLSTTYFASLEHIIDNGWRFKLSATRIKSELHSLASQVRYDSSNEQYNQVWGEYDYKDKQLSYEAQASGPFNLLGRTHELVFGFSRREGNLDSGDLGLDRDTYNNVDIRNWNHSTVPRPNWNGETSLLLRNKDQQNSGYIATRIDITDSFKLLIGSRLDWYKFKGEAGWGETGNYKINHNLTKYAGLIYNFDSWHSIYVSYTDIFKPQNNYDINAKLLDPVAGKNYEVGLKGEYFGGALNTSIAVFQIDQENIAMLVPDQSLCPGNMGCYQAAGLVRNRGIDLEMQGTITPNWQLRKF